MKTDDINRIINDLQENIKAGADINAGAGGYDIGTTESQAAFHAGRNRSWKEEVIDQLVCCHIYNGTHEHNPRKAVNDLISWHVQVALDPQVSSDAQALIDRGAAAEREACAKAVLDDAWALTFQTFGQYRTALAAAIRARGQA